MSHIFFVKLRYAFPNQPEAKRSNFHELPCELSCRILDPERRLFYRRLGSVFDALTSSR
jgi:hypothetical protein